MKNLGKRQQEMDFVTSIHTKYCKKKALLFHADWYTKKKQFLFILLSVFLSMYVLAVHHKCHATIFQSIYASVLDICALLSYFLFSEQKIYIFLFQSQTWCPLLYTQLCQDIHIIKMEVCNIIVYVLF